VLSIPADRTRITLPLLLAVLLLAGLAAGAAAGCGSEGGEHAAAVTDTPTATTPSVDVNAYASDIDDLANHADQVNRDYQQQAARHRAGTLDTAALVADADDGAGEFTAMLKALQEMEVPEGLKDAHQLLLSGFGKWLEFYRLQVSGLQRNDPAQLAQARELDNQAVSEVYEAIGDINQYLHS